MSTFWRVAGTPEAVNGGPPFSVSEKNVRDLFDEKTWDIQVIEEIDIMSDATYKESKERWTKAGLTDFRELVFLIKKKGGKKWWQVWK